jgi:hypothetical protein
MPKRFVHGRVVDAGGFGREPIDFKNGIEVIFGGQAVMPEMSVSTFRELPAFLPGNPGKSGGTRPDLPRF